MTDLIFEWDRGKAEASRRKHGIDFNEALTVFRDPFASIRPDPRHSVWEERHVILGCSQRGRLLIVMFTERAEGRVRLFSARRATPTERRMHEEKAR